MNIWIYVYECTGFNLIKNHPLDTTNITTYSIFCSEYNNLYIFNSIIIETDVGMHVMTD